MFINIFILGTLGVRNINSWYGQLGIHLIFLEGYLIQHWIIKGSGKVYEVQSLMFKKGNNIVKLDKAKDYPGFEIKASENINIESVVSNPFFHNFNILGISKKFKNFRNNKDLKDIGKPIRIKTEVREWIFFKA